MLRVKSTFTGVTAIIILFASSFSFLDYPLPSAKNIEKNLAKINDSLYAWRYETSNKEYNTFLADIVKKDSALHEKCLTDSLGWRQIMAYCEPMVEYYHRHPGFHDYPLVNVSYEGASEYCKWLSDLYNNEPKRKFKKVVFVLPSEKEWTLAAQGGRVNARYAWGSYSMRHKNGMYMCNFKHFDEMFITADSLGHPVINEEKAGRHYASSGLNDRAFYTSQVNTFWPNNFGLYNVCGNVAEMINIKGQSMGGSWNNYGGEVTTTSMKRYEESEPEVGFRVFMKVIE